MTASSDLVSDSMVNLRRLFHFVNDQSKQVENETGLNGTQLWAIKVIAESAPIKVSDVAHRMYLHPATVVGILDRLENKGLVLRTRSSKDRRVVEVTLTDQGEQVVARSPEVAQGLLVKGLEVLSENKLKNVSDGLKQLVAILGVQEIPPKSILSTELNLPQ